MKKFDHFLPNEIQTGNLPFRLIPGGLMKFGDFVQVQGKFPPLA